METEDSEMANYTHASSVRENYHASKSQCNMAEDPQSAIEDEEDITDNAMFEENPNRFYANQVSSAEYKQQAIDYTKIFVQNLTSSPEYLRVYTRCRLCWCSWSENQFSTSNCAECGGFGMTRSCPICQGKCDAVWTRDVELSHTHNEAHWNGECQLPPEEKQGYLAQFLIANNDGDIADSMADLAAV